MASCARHGHAIGFSDDGMSLEIRNASLLGPVLSQYFRHGHTSSFIRQLNNYGFKTICKCLAANCESAILTNRYLIIASPSSGNDRHAFAHPNFKRDDRALLESITRKAAMREKKRSKSDVIKELQQREFEQQARMMQLESRHHELMQKTVLLDAENKHLKTVVQNLRSTTTATSSTDLKRPSSSLDNHIHPPPHHLLQHHESSRDEDDFFKSASPVVLFEQHHHQLLHHPTHYQPYQQQCHSHLMNGMFAHFNNHSASPTPLDGLHHPSAMDSSNLHVNMDIMMSPMNSSSSPTPSSSNGTSPIETTRVELHDMDLVEESSKVIPQA